VTGGMADDDERNVPDDDAAHLLVVDDDTRIRNLLMQFLSRTAFASPSQAPPQRRGASSPGSISTC
jgi:hypothetical protein